MSTPPPRIYVASLSDYVNGRYHGKWIQAHPDPSVMQAEVVEMLRASRFPPAEDWAIHDYEGFGSIRLAGNTRLSTVAALVRDLLD